MPKLRVHNLAMSVDGYVAGPDQSLDAPLGVGGERLHDWAMVTRSFRTAHGMGDEGETGTDDDYIARGTTGIGATVMGRNMFSPYRGPWEGEAAEWTGWWEDEPPFHHPVFVLTHHPRPPLVLADTTFHFVRDGIEDALRQAYDAAGGLDVRLGGGADTVRQYLRAGLVDELHVAIVPILLGAEERLFEDVGGPDGYECVEHVASAGVTHVVFARRTG
ncbi:MAG TPA: dihydrofolate reductase family protein [Frankiaceae bacterium]|jgi:dihydrofolate reductase|nr:dihydrofolate reductase family protein [Frankiaceae bacterium]